MSRLTSRSHLHLLPEDVEGDFDQPFYARVTRITGDRVKFMGLLDVDGVEGATSATTVRLRLSVVRAPEVARAPGQSIVRRGVAVSSDGEFRHGQVLELERGLAKIDVGGEVIKVAPDTVVVVQPVVALLLRHTAFESDEWTLDELAEIHGEITERIVGTSGSNVIAEILDGLIDEDSLPDPTQDCQWIEAETGELRSFRLQHAVDFAYYVDGGVSPVPRGVGRSFCRPPPRENVTQQTRRQASTQGQLSLFDPLEDDDDTVPEPVDTLASRRTQVGRLKRPRDLAADGEPRDQQSAKRKHVTIDEPSGSVDCDARIIEKLLDDPELVERFLMLRKRNTRVQEGTELHLSGGSPTTSHAMERSQNSKYTFTPRDDQIQVHRRITADRYRGKQASLLFNVMVDSSAVLFKPLPGILTRTFDFQFGTRGLSIMHFRPMSQSEKIAWKSAGGSNFNNFSPTAEFERAPEPQSITELVDATSTLSHFGREFYSRAAQEVLEAMASVVRTISVTQRWAKNELSLLTYWINDVFEDYRTKIQISEAEATTVQQRCSIDDQLFRSLMHEMQQLRIERLEQVRNLFPVDTHNSDATPGRTGKREQRLSRQARKDLGPIPTRVLSLLPRQRNPTSGKEERLCMRYLSNDTCTSFSESKCQHRGRAHFVPSSLDKEVFAEISRRFGGLKPQFANLATSS